MTAKTPESKIDQAQVMYTNGETLSEISKKINVSADVISKRLRQRGIEIRKTSQGRASANAITTLPEKDICDKYISGNSENSLAGDFGVSRTVIRRILTKNKIHIRSQSESEKMKWSRMSEDQRRNQVKNCHALSIGRIKEDKEKHNMALARERLLIGHYIGVGEIEFKEKLELEKIPFVFQKAVLGYNLDFLIYGVDVELTSFTGKNAHHKIKPKTRAVNIFKDKGFNTLAIEIRTDQDMIDNFDFIIDTIKELSLIKKDLCQYWVLNIIDKGVLLRKSELNPA